jgi:hypothetical protein
MAPDEPKPTPDVTPESTDSPQKPALAWQPFTPGGIAALSQIPAGRLLVVQLVIAVLAAMVVLWFLSTAWFPVVQTAVDALPGNGVIRAGRLNSPYDSPEPLAMNRYLALMLDPRRARSASVASDVVVEFHAGEIRIRSLFGWLAFQYPAAGDVEAGRTAMLARWGAWRPHLLWMAAVGTVVGLMVGWTLLAAAYAPVVKLAAFYRERRAGWTACWRLAGAALMPGAVVMISATALYGLGTLNLIEFLVIAGLHVMIGWVFLLLPLKHLPIRSDAAASIANPFLPAPPETDAANEAGPAAEDSRGRRPGNNPFARSPDQP